MKTKEKILSAVMSIYMEYDVQGITMKRVAEKAGIGKSTVYEYFDNKEHMMAEAILYASHQLVDRFYESAWNNKSLNFEEALRLSIQGVLQAFSGELGKFMKIIEESNHGGNKSMMFNKVHKEIQELQEKATDYTKRLIEKGQNEGVIREGLVTMDVINFQRIYIVLCAGFSSKGDMCMDYVKDIEDRESYVYENLMRLYGK